MAQEVGLSAVCDEIGQAFGRGDLQRVDQMLWPALDQFPDMPQLWFYAGNLCFQIGRVALSDQCFQRCIDLDSNPLVMANQGAAKRRLNQHDEGQAVLKAALERAPDYEPALVNLGSMYVNEGTPELGIPYLERACVLGHQKGRYEKGSRWNLALLYLEAARFDEGFELYRTGLGAERLVRNYAVDDIPEPAQLQPEHKGGTLIVYGEQGIGDEIMVGQLIAEAQEEFDHVIFECHPRLEKIHRAAHPGLTLYPTRKDTHIAWPAADRIRADYKAPIFDLASRYRKDVASFKAGWAKRGPIYRADTEETSRYRAQLLDAASGRPIVALAAHGGVLTTARQYRTIRMGDIERLFQETDAVFVCVDYDDMSDFAIEVQQKFGEGRFHWYPSIVQHWDYDHTAALLAACDLTVTVCQSVFHLSAGMGLKTRCLTPKRCAWRYAAIPGEPELSYWYPSPDVKLYRQDSENGWGSALDRVIADIRGLA
jgi:tetratricopeptide (TPR) repeat protein